jgi:dihydroorotate dehydrogenase
MSNLSIKIAGLKFRNPVFTAAGPTSKDGMALLNAATVEQEVLWQRQSV